LICSNIPSRKKCPIMKAHCYKKIHECVFFWCNVCDFLNLSIFVREYSTRSPGTSNSKERYVTKQQTSHNNMQKTRPRHLNFERFYWGSVFARQKKHSVDHFSRQIFPYVYNWILKEILELLGLFEFMGSGVRMGKCSLNSF